MPGQSLYLRSLLVRLREVREALGVSRAEIERRLLLGPGWIARFEEGRTVPTLDVLIAILGQLGQGLKDILPDADRADGTNEIVRGVSAEEDGPNLAIRFRYGGYDASYLLPGGLKSEFDVVIKEIQDGLCAVTGSDPCREQAIKTDAVARAFLRAVKFWPNVNPSDLWWFLIYRAFCDPFNHPAVCARLDFEQSWKRTGGWALEEVLVRHYAPFLQRNGVRLFIPAGPEKERLIATVKVRDRLEAAKVDVLLTGKREEEEMVFGVVHVKASFAERRTDDVPMSRSLIRAGYASPLWTMDCKSMPAERPINKGELGEALGRHNDRKSAKRKDIEDDGYFSACFSYNSNTVPTPPGRRAKARVHVCNFNDPDDAFTRYVLEHWRRFAAP